MTKFKMSLKQIGLLTAGAQPWSPRMCTANGDRFAYCSTLATYIYEVYMVSFCLICFAVKQFRTQVMFFHQLRIREEVSKCRSV